MRSQRVAAAARGHELLAGGPARPTSDMSRSAESAGTTPTALVFFALSSRFSQLGLSVKDMFNFCMAPASASDLRLSAALLQFATKYRWGVGAVEMPLRCRRPCHPTHNPLTHPLTHPPSAPARPLPPNCRSKGLPVTLDIAVPDRVPANTEELRHMEAAHQVAMLWLWLSYRFDAEAFPLRAKVGAGGAGRTAGCWKAWWGWEPEAAARPGHRQHESVPVRAAPTAPAHQQLM